MATNVQSAGNGGGASSIGSAIGSMGGVVSSVQQISAPQMSAPPAVASSGVPANADQPVAASVATTTTQPAPAASPAAPRSDFFSSAAKVAQSAGGIRGGNKFPGVADVITAFGGVVQSLQ